MKPTHAIVPALAGLFLLMTGAPAVAAPASTDYPGWVIERAALASAVAGGVLVLLRKWRAAWICATLLAFFAFAALGWDWYRNRAVDAEAPTAGVQAVLGRDS